MMSEDYEMINEIDGCVASAIDLMKHTGHIECEALDRAIKHLKDASGAIGTALEKLDA